MASTFTNFDTRELSRRKHQLLDDFSYYDEETQFTITAKKQFVTNFASIEGLRYIGALIFILIAGFGNKVATIHDWLYSGYGLLKADGTVYYPSRKECDQILYRALRAEGLARWRAAIFYIGVRIGGASHYSAKPATFTA